MLFPEFFFGESFSFMDSIKAGEVQCSIMDPGIQGRLDPNGSPEAPSGKLDFRRLSRAPGKEHQSHPVLG